MLNKNYFYFLFLLFFISCTSNQSKPALFNNEICQVDSVRLSRIGKPDWIDIKSYPEEELTLSFADKTCKVYRDGNLLIRNLLNEEDIQTTKEKLDKIKLHDLNRIYNTNAVWNIELEVFIFCHKDANAYIIKSFGQHGENPEEIKDLYSFLLRSMASNLKNLNK